MTASSATALNLSEDPHFIRVYSVKDCVVMETSCGTEGPSQNIYLTLAEVRVLITGLTAARSAVRATQRELAARDAEERARVVKDLQKELEKEMHK